MRKYIVEGEGLPRLSSPISHAVVVNDTCYVSGQLALDADGGYVSGSVADEALLAFSNLFKVLFAAGFQKSDLAFVDIALVDIADMAPLNAVCRGLFMGEGFPARTVAQAAALPFGGKVKIVGVAIRDHASPGDHVVRVSPLS